MSSFASMGKFQAPDMWNFPPFFTLQPVAETRKKQLDAWKQLILDYHACQNTFRMVPISFQLFSNPNINRTMSVEGVSAIIDHMIAMGNAEWEDSTKTALHIIWCSPDMIAENLYQWVDGKGLINDVMTLYELQSSDEHPDSVLIGVDIYIIRRALKILEMKEKCKIMAGPSPDEDGVKFLSI